MLEKKLDELEVREEKYKTVTMKVEPKEKSGRIPLEVKHLTFHYPGKSDLYRIYLLKCKRREVFNSWRKWSREINFIKINYE